MANQKMITMWNDSYNDHDTNLSIFLGGIKKNIPGNDSFFY